MKVFIFIWLGQFISLLGSRLTSFGLNVWIYEQTQSTTDFGLLVICSSLTGLIASPVIGIFVDQWSRRWTMIVCDLCEALCTLCIAWLFLTEQIEIWHLYLNAIISSCFNSCQSTAYLAGTTLLVPQEYLIRASGLTSISRSISKLVSSTLAGILLVIVKLEGLFLIDFVTFFFGVIPLLLVKFPEVEERADTTSKETPEKSLFEETTYGWHYLTTKPGLLGLLLFFAITNIFVGSFNVLATPLLLSLGSPIVLGIVLSIASSGSLVGGLLVSIWKEPENSIKTLFNFRLLAGLFILIAGLRPSLYLFAISLFGLYFTVPVVISLVQVIFQKKVPPEVQGRVFSLKEGIGTIGLTLGYAIAGPLDDLVFEPLMAPNGLLANNIGQIIGIGKGRGIALFDIVMGLLLILGTIAAYQYPRLQKVDSNHSQL